MTTPLSPAAEAVLDAAYALPLNKGQPSIAAALRAAADQMSCYQSKKFLYSIADTMKLFAIADELESQP
jgi:hypothetical protein